MPIITKTGVKIITQNQYIEMLKSLYLSIDSEWILDSNSPDGQFIMLISRMLWEKEQEAVSVYNSRDPKTARKTQVDDLASLFDTYRDIAKQSTIFFDCVGKRGKKLKKGDQIKNIQTGDIWSLDSDVVIPNKGKFVSNDYGVITDTGEFKPAINIDGWTGVENPSNFVVGRNDETDAELEQKRQDRITIASKNQRTSIKAAILGVEGVISADVIENDDDFVVNGQAANSVHCIVHGGDELKICSAIDSKVSIGCKTVGSIEHRVFDDDDPYGMIRRFDRPTLVNVWVKYKINNLNLIPEKERRKIPLFVEEYANGLLDLPYSSNDKGFKLGQSPSSDLLNVPLTCAVGDYIASNSEIYTISVELSKDGRQWTNTKLDIKRFEIPVFDKERVSVVNNEE